MIAEVIYDLLSRHAEVAPAQVCAVRGEERLTFAELRDRVDTCARALLAAGVVRGDRVATLAPPGLEFWISCLATTSIGAIWVGINPVYREREFAYLLQDARPTVVFVVSPFDGRWYDQEILAFADDVREVVTFGQASEGATDAVSFLGRGARIADEKLLAARAAVGPGDVAVIVYTSGTTGQPKGAMLSQGTITRSAVANAAWMGDRLQSTVCVSPINHVGGLNNVCMNVLAAGGRIIFHHKVDIEALGRIRAAEQPTYLVTSPIGFMMTMARPGFAPERLAHTRLIVCGGATTPINILRAWSPVGCPIASVYGQTETCGIITHTDLTAPLEDVATTIGRPLAGCEARVVRADGAPCSAGETGELQFRGPYVMSGYFNRPDATAAAFTADGFLRTGDLGFQREDGNLVFVGRIKEMFKSGGYNIYPLEVEQAIAEHDDVLLSAVMPVPHPLYQEVGHAFIMPKAGHVVSAEAIRTFLRGRIANYKVPKDFTIEAVLPLLPNGKVDRQALARRLAAER